MNDTEHLNRDQIRIGDSDFQKFRKLTYNVISKGCKAGFRFSGRVKERILDNFYRRDPADFLSSIGNEYLSTKKNDEATWRDLTDFGIALILGCGLITGGQAYLARHPNIESRIEQLGHPISQSSDQGQRKEKIFPMGDKSFNVVGPTTYFAKDSASTKAVFNYLCHYHNLPPQFGTATKQEVKAFIDAQSKEYGSCPK